MVRIGEVAVHSPDNLAIVTGATEATPLIAFPGSVSRPLLVRVINDSVPDMPNDYLTGWQLLMSVVPDAGATGTVEFHSANEPDNYVFEPIGNLGVGVVNSGDSMLAFDVNFPYSGGVEVPTSPGANLLDVSFTISPDALGSFSVFAIGGNGNSEWTDAEQPILNGRAFANLPDDGVPVLIGRILVTQLLGDLNLDGLVDRRDVSLFLRNFGRESGASLTSGDLDFDGAVTLKDLAILQGNLNQQVAPAPATGAGVPEPSTLLLSALALAFWVFFPHSRVRRVV